MIHRSVSISKNSSFFLFGARGTGKSTYIREQFLPTIKSKVLYYDLLNDDVEERLSRNPQLLKTDLSKSKEKPNWIVIDEIQKIPRLLDVVHSIIETDKIKFALTGSSARKLKLLGSNLLAGRAFEYRLWPFSFYEQENFDLQENLNFGNLPSVFSFKEPADKEKYLKTYVSTYVKQEVQIEQLVRKIDPFKNFLEVAAQMNGKLLNFSKISRDVGVDTKTIIQYYQILEDTYLGFTLPAFHTSLRKSLLTTPKFYFFDIGVKRALERSLQTVPSPGTSYYGDTFEHFVILEAFKLNQYTESDFLLSYFATKDGAEIDLVLSRGKKEIIFVEIKSSKSVDTIEVGKLAKIRGQEKIKSYYLSLDPVPQEINGVRCLYWEEGLKEIFGLE